MTKKRGIKTWLLDHKIYIGSFFIPFLVMTVLCIVYGVEPFGDKSLAIIDGLHQYMPFFAEYHEKVRNLDSFFYSWNGGLGYNFLSLWSYYLASPLNLLMLLFPKTMLNAAFSWILVVKIGLLGLTTGVFLIHRSNKNNSKVLIFSTAFAFSNYIVGYSWNIMWMDAIVMFPLILLGFDKMMEKKDGRLYSFCLALAMLGNFYIAFMICIFLVLWFLFYEHKDGKSLFGRGLCFAWYSILGAALAGIGLMPAFLGIMNTASADSMSLPAHRWLTNGYDILKTHLVATAPITNDNFDGNANLYISILAILLVFVYFLGREISWREKGKRALFLGVFLLSFNETVLNFIWHGFHDQYGIPNRFAFLYLFLIILTGFEALEKISVMEKHHIALATILGVLSVVVIAKGADTEPGKLEFWLTLALLLFYGGFLLAYVTKRISWKKGMAVIGLVAMAEIIVMAAYGFSENGQIQIDKFYSDTEMIETIKEDIGDELVRTSLVSTKMLDEEIWHGLKCVSLFGSTANGGAVSMMDHWGFYTGANEYLYRGSSPLTNVLMNVKYNIRRGADANINGFKIVKSYENMDLLENPYDTAIGYGLTGHLDEWNYQTVYPFDVQNSFVNDAFHMGEIFEDIEIPDPQTYECTATRTNRGEYRFTNTSSQANNIVFTIPTTGGEDLYIHYDGSRVENTIVKVGEEVRVNKKINSEIYHIGLIEPGQMVTVSMQLKDEGDNSGVVRLSAADFKEKRFQAIYEKLYEERVVVTYYTSDSLEGYVNKAEDGLVLFSIPYDEGWTVLVDGEEVEKVVLADGLLAIDMTEGFHNVSLSYVSPGFREGLFLTLAGIFFFIVISVYFHRKKAVIIEEEDKEQHFEENV